MTTEELLTEICGIFNADIKRIKGKSRNYKDGTVRVRHYYCYIAYYYYDMSLKTIGRSINRDHTSIINGRNSIASSLQDMVEPIVSDIETIINNLDVPKKEGAYKSIVAKYDGLLEEFLELKKKNKSLSFQLEQKDIEIQALKEKLDRSMPRSIFGDRMIVEPLKEEHLK